MVDLTFAKNVISCRFQGCPLVSMAKHRHMSCNQANGIVPAHMQHPVVDMEILNQVLESSGTCLKSLTYTSHRVGEAKSKTLQRCKNMAHTTACCTHHLQHWQYHASNPDLGKWLNDNKGLVSSCRTDNVSQALLM